MNNKHGSGECKMREWKIGENTKDNPKLNE